MMRLLLFSLVVFIVVRVEAQLPSLEKEFPESFKVQVVNPLNAGRESVLVVVTTDQLKKVKGFNPKAFVVISGGAEIASQYNADDLSSGVVFVLADMRPKEKREVVILYNPAGTSARNYPKLTQAELSYRTGGEWKNREYIGGNFKNTEFLRVPKEHKDHSWFIRYEGPGWESDKVGYRLYLDQRNATDVFGKKVTAPVLQEVGQDGFDSYHNMQSWGMDVMKVGKSLGVGSIGSLVSGTAIRVEKTDSVTCLISENGPAYSSLEINYLGWQIGGKKHDLKSHISIHAGTRLTREHLTVSGDPQSLCTGIVKDVKAKLTNNRGDAQRWGYVSTYGTQSLNNDDLGLVVFFDPSQFAGFTEDEFSHIVSLKPRGGKLQYYLAGVWSGEPGGIKDEAEFTAYVNAMATELANPVQVKVVLK
jgi:hypothetical protein